MEGKLLPEIACVAAETFSILHYYSALVLSQGPLSVAVFARSGHEWSTLFDIAKLYLSDELVQTSMIFSFVWPVSGVSGLPSRPLSVLHQNVSESNYNHADAYPNNLLRNTARRAVFTDFTLVIDIDMTPSEGLREV